MSLIKYMLGLLLGQRTKKDWLILYSGKDRYPGSCNCKPLPGRFRRWLLNINYGAVLECKHGIRWILKEDRSWPGRLDWTYHNG